jgi:hypothetical protein
MGTRCADHATPLYPQKLAITSPINGGLSVGVVRLQTKSHGVRQSVSLRCGCFAQAATTVPSADLPPLVRFAVTMENVFWDIKTQFVPHRRHITSPLQSPASQCYVRVDVSWR